MLVMLTFIFKNAIAAKYAKLCSFLFIYNCILPEKLAACHTMIKSDQYWPRIDQELIINSHFSPHPLSFSLSSLALPYSVFLTHYFNPLRQNLKINIRYSLSIPYKCVCVCVCGMIRDAVTQAHSFIAAVCFWHHCSEHCLICVAVRDSRGSSDTHHPWWQSKASAAVSSYCQASS